MSASVAEILAAARAEEVALVGEVCGYLVLGAADEVLETEAFPAADGIRIHDDGNVAVSGVKVADAVRERALREILGLLLAQVRTPFPNLARVAGRSDARGMASLVTELEAALVPVNRRAARRSLSRLSREARRAVERGLVVAQIPFPSKASFESDEPEAELAQSLPSMILPGPETELGVSDGSELQFASETQELSVEADPFDDEPTVVVGPVEESLTDLVAELVASSQRSPAGDAIDLFDLNIDVDFGPDEGLAEPAAVDSLWPEPAPMDSLWPAPRTLSEPELAPLDSPRPEPVHADPVPAPPAARSTNPPSRPGSDRYRTVRPRSDLPPKNPTPLIPPSEGGRARPSDVEGLLSSLKPRVQPDQLHQALEGLTLGSTRSGEG